MLITHLKEACPRRWTPASVDIGDLVTFYKQAKKRFDEDDDFKGRSREAVVGLQSGDAQAQAWEILCDQSRKEFQKIYDRLGIRIQSGANPSTIPCCQMW
jgi:arginyl-tRNA synthetase